MHTTSFMDVDLLKRTVLNLLTILLLLGAANAQSLDSQVRQFLAEADARYVRGVLPSDERAESREIGKKLVSMPPEALDSALRLFSIESEEDALLWRFKVISFIEGMYRTHPISPEKHKQVADVVFREMIQPETRTAHFSDIHWALAFFKKWGVNEDMEMLTPLLSHPDAEIQRHVAGALGGMAMERGLPAPTPPPSGTFALRANPSAKTPTPLPVANEAKPTSPQPKALSVSPSATVSIRSTRTRWFVAAAVLVACGVLLRWLVHDPSKRK